MKTKDWTKGLSVRARNIIYQNDLWIRDAAEKALKDGSFLKLRNCGKQTYIEIGIALGLVVQLNPLKSLPALCPYCKKEFNVAVQVRSKKE